MTPNEAADIQRKAELLARVNLFMNDLSTVGNLAGALINVQVELVNTMFFNLFHIAKTEPFIHLKVPVPALNQEFFDKVTEILYHSPEAIQAVTQRALFYPEHARKQFGESVAPTPDTKKKKGKQASKKKAKVIAPAPTPPASPSPVKGPSSPPATVSNSVHCVNHAASLMASQWPQGAPPPAGCHPTNGKPCTRQHSMTISPGIPITVGLFNDLMNGVEGFRNAKAFAANFKTTLNGWK